MATAQRSRSHNRLPSDDKYRQFFERAPVALYRTAPDGAVLDVNESLLRLLAYPDRAAFARVNAADVYVDPTEREAWRMLLEQEGEASFEMRDRRYDGRVIWVRDTARAVRDDDGELLWFEGMLEDISATKPVLLDSEEERFRLLATASDEIIWDWDARTGQVVWNEALRTVFGHDPQCVGPAIEQSDAWWTRHIHPEDRARVLQSVRSALESGVPIWTESYRFRRLDASYASVFERRYLAHAADGQPIRIIGAMLDLSPRIQPASERVSSSEGATPRTSDATLISWIVDGDGRALDELYARHATMLLKSAYMLLDSAEDAEEVVGDVFVRVWSNGANYCAERGSVAGWLVTLCRARALDMQRKRRRRLKLLEGSFESAQPATPGEHAGVALVAAENVASYHAVAECLDHLSAPQRAVIELAYFSGMTHAQIAAQLRQPLGTVKTRLRAGLSTLRRHVMTA